MWLADQRRRPMRPASALTAASAVRWSPSQVSRLPVVSVQASVRIHGRGWLVGTFTGMRDAVICEPLRTPVGAFGGSLKSVPAHQLATTVIRAVLERTGLPVAALDAGLPVTVTGLQIDGRCGSGLQAVIYAAMQVQAGASEVVLAGGAESMSKAPLYSTGMRWGAGTQPAVTLHDALARGRVTAGGIHHPVPGGMLETAENLRREYGISRLEQDEYAVESHRRAARATECGLFADEIVPLTVPSRKADVVVDRDEHI